MSKKKQCFSHTGLAMPQEAKQCALKKCFNFCLFGGLKIAVEAREQEIHPKIGKDDRAESYDGEEGGLFTVPRTSVSSM